MSSEIIYQDRIVCTREPYVEVLVCMLLELAGRKQKDNWLNKAISVWDANKSGRGLGMTDLGFPEIITSESERDRMVSLLRELENYISNFGESISAEELNRMKPPYTQFMRDMPTSKLTELVGRIREMLQ